MNRKRVFLPLALAAVLCLLVGSCSLSTETTEQPTQIETEERTFTPTAEPAVASSPTPETATEPTTTEAPQIPARPLSEQGPWLVMVLNDGIWAANPDGSGLTHLLPVALERWSYSEAVVSEQNGLVAFLDGSDRYFDLILTIYSIPQRRILRNIALTTPETEPSRDPVMNEAMEGARAISDFASYAFSPDSSLLAFMGLIEGSTSDLYVYDVDNDSITRLTDGPSQGFNPHWSPDGRYILHFGAKGFGTGAGYVMDGVWAAPPDEGDVLTLYDPSDSAAEEFVGWLDDSTFLVNSWNMRCGSVNLRAYNINTRSEQILWPDVINDIVYDQDSGTLAIAVGTDSEDCNPQGKMGVFLIPLDGRSPQLALEGGIRYLMHNEFVFSVIASKDGSKETQILPNGQLVPLNSKPIKFDYPRPALSPDGQWIAWTGDQAWIGKYDSSGEMPPELFLDERMIQSVWSPDSKTLFLFGPESLYVAYAPMFTPIKLVEKGDFYQISVFWLSP